MRTALLLTSWAALALLAVPLARAQTPRGVRAPIVAPPVGKIIDQQGVLRTVSGIAGSFLTGPGEAQGVAALDCSGEVCVTSSSADVMATDGKRAIAYSAATNTFTGWVIGRPVPEPLAWNPLVDGDRVLSIRLTGAGAEIAVRRGGAVWIVSQDGAVVDALPPEADGAVLLLDDAALFAAGNTVVLRRADGSETSFPVAAASALYRMSAEWVEVVTDDAPLALRTTVGREGIFMLPRGSE